MTLLRKLQAHYSEDPAELVRQIQELERSVDETVKELSPSFCSGIVPSDGTYSDGDELRLTEGAQTEGYSVSSTSVKLAGAGAYRITISFRASRSSASTGWNVRITEGGAIIATFFGPAVAADVNGVIVATLVVSLKGGPIAFQVGNGNITTIRNFSHWSFERLRAE